MSRLKVIAAGVVAVVAIAAVAFVMRGRGDGGQGSVAVVSPPVTVKPVEGLSPVFVDRLTRLLENAGVQVLPDRAVFDGGDTANVDGFAVSQFQVRNMAVEIAGNAGGGFYGSQLDDLIPLPQGVPPMSYFIAAWLALGSTPAAKAAGELMGERNWRRAPDLVFPTVVLAAFVGDAVRFGNEGGDVPPKLAQLDRRRFGNLEVMSAGIPVFAAHSGAADGPCGTVNNFVDSMLSKVFNALKIKETTGITGFFVDVFNKAIELASEVIKGLVSVLTAPIAGALRTAIGIVGVVSYASSLLKPWSVRVEASPNPNRYAVDKEPPPEGIITARIDDAGFPGWPQSLQECARLFGSELPSSDADVGSPVTWTTTGPGRGATALVSRDLQLPADKVAKTRYNVNRSETKEDAQRGKIIDDTVTVQVGFERLAITKLRAFLKGLIHGQIPGIVAPIVNPLLTPITNGILGKLATYLQANGSTVLTIRHHSLVRCRLFTLAEINKALKQSFDVVAEIPPTGCAAGTPGGPNFGYYYSAASCQLAMGAVSLVGVTPLNLGPASFYIHSGDAHVIGFPAVSSPNHCVLINASPRSAFAGRDLVNLATTIRPRS